MITDHGTFTTYIPAQPPFSAKFARNEAGKDFYELRATLRGQVGRTWLVVSPSGIVQMASNSVDDLFAESGRRLVSIDRARDPASTVGMAVDLTTGVLSAPPAVSRAIHVSKADIWRRATDQEAATIDAALAARPLRERNIFRDATYLSSDDELFADLKVGFVQAFGQTRADALLAASQV